MIETYINESTLPFPFCPGCGHTGILKALDTALVRLQIDPHDLVIVTDIGCQGLSDKFFDTNAFHGLHGRSVTYASGIKLANPDLHVITLIGDGGCGIGGHHLINAARRNIGVTVLVFNNLNFGMTGGEHSVTTPPDAITVTTRRGNLEQPLDICGTVAVNGAGFAARTTVFDKSLPDLIADAIRFDGFALVDIWELCTAYFAPTNQFKKQSIEDTLDQLGFPTGVIRERTDRPEYSRAYRAASADQVGQPTLAPHPIDPAYSSDLATRQSWVIAGAAGQRIGSAAVLLCQGAILSGLWATQHNDYPVTVKTGHSVADVILSPDPVLHLGISDPDVMVVLFPEGLAKERARIARLRPGATVYITADLLDQHPVETAARLVPLDLGATGQQKSYWALIALAAILRATGAYPVEAFRAAMEQSPYAEKNLAALDAADNRTIRVE
ncbi:MAG: 2-oxoacid:acceptor oxidoreductase family protein [Anaerolineae bacterium]|nr:2-oxoacid:acceptor oxidoreductase family protein [Anaerolineae bacterium]